MTSRADLLDGGEKVCCCGHPRDRHVIGPDDWGWCEDCDCTIYRARAARPDEYAAAAMEAGARLLPQPTNNYAIAGTWCAGVSFTPTDAVGDRTTYLDWAYLAEVVAWHYGLDARDITEAEI